MELMNLYFTFFSHANSQISAISKALGLAFHHQGPIVINAYCQAATNLIDQNREGGNEADMRKV